MFQDKLTIPIFILKNVSINHWHFLCPLTKKGGNKIYIPSITNIENALKIYYENSEIGNKEINCLFGNRSSATISRLKRLVKAEMIKRNMPTFNAYKVNTAIAYDVWGIDVTDLEKRMKKIKELSL